VAANAVVGAEPCCRGAGGGAEYIAGGRETGTKALTGWTALPGPAVGVNCICAGIALVGAAGYARGPAAAK